MTRHHPRKSRGRPKKRPHAAARFVTRHIMHGGKADLGEIYTAMADGKFSMLAKQSNTRLLCKVKEVYFIWSTRSKQLITVLSPEMAASQMRSYA